MGGKRGLSAKQRLDKYTNKEGPEGYDRSFDPPLALGRCHEWTMAVRNGYGVLRVNGETLYCHRLSYQLGTGGDENISGLFVIHRCDNRKCVRFSHLRLSTQLENVIDMMSKGRDRKVSGNTHASHRRKGITHWNTKYVDEDLVLEQYATKRWSQTALAKEHGVSQAVISKIVRGVRRMKVTRTLT